MHSSGQFSAIILILISMPNCCNSLLNGIFRGAIKQRSGGAIASSYSCYSISPLSLLLSKNPHNAGRNGKTSQSSRSSFATRLVSGAGVLAVSGSQLDAQCDGAEILKESSVAAVEAPVDKLAHTAMYPPLVAYFKGKLCVTPTQTIAYSMYGNPQGKPVLVVHGGPGGGTDPVMARYFDPTVYKIILVDQRGCGESSQTADISENTTYDLISDFEKIRIKLGIAKWQLFGGSWGSCLSLAYAIKHPEVVTELVLRGIFLVRKKEINWLYQGPGANYLFPEDWAAYEAAIPIEERGDYLLAYGRRLRGELGEEEVKKAAVAWSVWEGRTSNLIQAPMEVTAKKFGDAAFSFQFASIENHYFTNNGFLPRDGYLIEKENIDRIRHIPTIIVQGRYDVVCPCVSAYDLKKAFPEAELRITMAGHSGLEIENIKQLVSATEIYKSL